MSKSKLHTILSSVQMKANTRKHLINELSKTGVSENNTYICKINTDGQTNYNKLHNAIQEGKQIFIDKDNLILPYMCYIVSDRYIVCYPLVLGSLDDDKTEIQLVGHIMYMNGNFCYTDEFDIIFKIAGDGTKFLSDDGKYHDITIDAINGLSARLESIENRIKALEDAANA